MRVMARGGTADSRASRPRQDVPSSKRLPISLTVIVADGGSTGSRRETVTRRSHGTPHLRGRHGSHRRTFPELRSLARNNPLSLPYPTAPRRDVLGRSSVAYSPGLWLVRWSAPGTISRWFCSARGASARPRSPFDTSRTSSTTSISPRYRWLPSPPVSLCVRLRCTMDLSSFCFTRITAFARIKLYFFRELYFNREFEHVRFERETSFCDISPPATHDSFKSGLCDYVERKSYVLD